jgi:hypothetical protein
LPKTGVFPNKNWDGQPFGGKRCDDEGGSAVEIRMYGGNGFKAFHVPVKGQLELDGYQIETLKDVKEVTVFEARQLKVNGKTPLDKWLPYKSTSSKKVKVASIALNTEWKNLDWDAENLRERDDYPKEKVEVVKAEGLRRWIIRLQQKEHKEAP